MSKSRFTFVHPDLLPMLGVKRKLPKEGLPPQQLVAMDHKQGVTVPVSVWVAPHVPKLGRRWDGHEYVETVVKSSKHRVRCACPGCGAEISAGRLFQHVCNRRKQQPARFEHGGPDQSDKLPSSYIGDDR